MEELLESITYRNEECNAEPDEIAEQVTRLDDAISVIKQPEEVIMSQKKIIIELLFKEGCILKKIKDIEIFLKR